MQRVARCRFAADLRAAAQFAVSAGGFTSPKNIRMTPEPAKAATVRTADISRRGAVRSQDADASRASLPSHFPYLAWECSPCNANV